MESKKMCSCDCGSCSWAHGGGRYYIWYKILIAIFFVMVFCFGIKYGETRAYIKILNGNQMHWGNKSNSRMFDYNKKPNFTIDKAVGTTETQAN